MTSARCEYCGEWEENGVDLCRCCRHCEECKLLHAKHKYDAKPVRVNLASDSSKAEEYFKQKGWAEW